FDDLGTRHAGREAPDVVGREQILDGLHVLVRPERHAIVVIARRLQRVVPVRRAVGQHALRDRLSPARFNIPRPRAGRDELGQAVDCAAAQRERKDEGRAPESRHGGDRIISAIGRERRFQAPIPPVHRRQGGFVAWSWRYSTRPSNMSARGRRARGRPLLSGVSAPNFSGRKTMKFAALCTTFLLLLAAQTAFGQDKPYKEGSVWTVTFVKVKPGMLDTYLRDLGANRKKLMEQAKK